MAPAAPTATSVRMKSRRLSLSRVLLVLALVVPSVATAATTRPEPPLRFGPEFPVSPAMEARVRFWIRIFTAVSHTEAVLHDRDDPRLVYDVVPYDGDTLDAARASYARLLASMTADEIFPA